MRSDLKDHVELSACVIGRIWKEMLLPNWLVVGVDPHGCIVLSVSVRMSLIRNCIFFVCPAEPRCVLAAHFRDFPLNSHSPSMNRKHRNGNSMLWSV